MDKNFYATDGKSLFKLDKEHIIQEGIKEALKGRLDNANCVEFR